MLRKDCSSAVVNIALKKGRGKKREKKNYYYTGDSNLVTHPSTNPAEQGLTSLSERSMFLVV